MCHDLISSNLEKEKNHIPNFGWKFVLTLVGNSCTYNTYKLGMDLWLVMGSATIADHLRNFGTNGDQYEVVEIFPM